MRPKQIYIMKCFSQDYFISDIKTQKPKGSCQAGPEFRPEVLWRTWHIAPAVLMCLSCLSPLSRPFYYFLSTQLIFPDVPVRCQIYREKL